MDLRVNLQRIRVQDSGIDLWESVWDVQRGIQVTSPQSDGCSLSPEEEDDEDSDSDPFYGFSPQSTYETASTENNTERRSIFQFSDSE